LADAAERRSERLLMSPAEKHPIGQQALASHPVERQGAVE
jgi:hypothetical protein